ncbi:MAG: hypothetical protein C0478_09565 [Planctomyces sp.]|nr:hypothetical protein [Planctomyces sp.]
MHGQLAVESSVATSVDGIDASQHPVAIGTFAVHSIVGSTLQVAKAVAGIEMFAVRLPAGVVRVVDPSVAPV